MRNQRAFNLITAVVSVAAVLVLLFVGSLLPAMPAVNGAPAAAVLTPVSNDNASLGARVATWANVEVFTADDTSCFELGNYDVIDLQYVIDQGTVNTTTITQQYSNDNVTMVDGAAVVTANAADANGMAQYALFGRYGCMKIDVANANPITITLIGVAK